MSVLIDHTSVPSLRSRIGRLLAAAGAADFAVERIRVAGIDLSRDELGSVGRCRVLIRRVDASLFADISETLETDPRRLNHLLALRAFLASGRAEIAAAGASTWTPDFSVLHDVRAGATARRSYVLVGAHYFGRPYPAVGPSLTCVLDDDDAVALAAARFEALWAHAHDVRAVVTTELDRVLARAGA